MYDQIRTYIEQGNLVEAERLLDRLGSHDAEWYFLKGMVQHKKGWHDQAESNIRIARDMDPQNAEYNAVLNNMFNKRTAYRNVGDNGGYNTSAGRGCSSCDCCTSLICADCCCECCGGDLISCC